MLGDLNIAEPGALIGFAGPRVIEQTIRQKLPEGLPARASSCSSTACWTWWWTAGNLKATLVKSFGFLLLN